MNLHAARGKKLMICIRKEKYKRFRKRKERCMLQEFFFPKRFDVE
jgi:hypothetical protein